MSPPRVLKGGGGGCAPQETQFLLKIIDVIFDVMKN